MTVRVTHAAFAAVGMRQRANWPEVFEMTVGDVHLEAVDHGEECGVLLIGTRATRRTAGFEQRTLPSPPNVPVLAHAILDLVRALCPEAVSEEEHQAHRFVRRMRLCMPKLVIPRALLRSGLQALASQLRTKERGAEVELAFREQDPHEGYGRLDIRFHGGRVSFPAQGTWPVPARVAAAELIAVLDRRFQRDPVDVRGDLADFERLWVGHCLLRCRWQVESD